MRKSSGLRTGATIISFNRNPAGNIRFMTATDLLQSAGDGNAKMLAIALTGIAPEHVDQRAHSTMMSFREHVNHISECAFVVIKMGRGEEHTFGTFSSDHPEFSAMIQEMFALRKQVLDAAVSSGADQDITTAWNYIIEHEMYHIGQIAATRQALEPAWSSHSLYQ